MHTAITRQNDVGDRHTGAYAQRLSVSIFIAAVYALFMITARLYAVERRIHTLLCVPKYCSPSYDTAFTNHCYSYVTQSHNHTRTATACRTHHLNHHSPMHRRKLSLLTRLPRRQTRRPAHTSRAPHMYDWRARAASACASAAAASSTRH